MDQSEWMIYLYKDVLTGKRNKLIYSLLNHTRAWGGGWGGPPLPLDGLTPPFRKWTPRMTLPPSELGTPNFRHLTHPL